MSASRFKRIAQRQRSQTSTDSSDGMSHRLRKAGCKRIFREKLSGPTAGWRHNREASNSRWTLYLKIRRSLPQ
jgi:hypothetical protein